MSGRIIFEPTDEAACERNRDCADKPIAYLLRPGTIWKCDDCGREWVVVEGAQYNESYKAWRILTERNRKGVDR